MENTRTDIHEHLSEVGMLRNNAMSVAKEVLEGDKENVTIALERRLIKPERMESPPRYHELHDADAFIRYAKMKQTDDSVVLCDLDNARFYFIPDEEAPNGFELIRWPVQYDSLYLQLDSLQGVHAARVFAQKIRQLRDYVTATDLDGQQLAMVMQRIRVATNITSETGTGTKCVNGMMVETEITGGQGYEHLELPDEIIFRTPIYIDTEPRDIRLTITVTATSPENVSVKVTCPLLGRYRREALTGLSAKVFTDLTNANIVCLHGRPKYGEWKYHRENEQY